MREHHADKRISKYSKPEEVKIKVLGIRVLCEKEKCFFQKFRLQQSVKFAVLIVAKRATIKSKLGSLLPAGFRKFNTNIIKVCNKLKVSTTVKRQLAFKHFQLPSNKQSSEQEERQRAYKKHRFVI